MLDSLKDCIEVPICFFLLGSLNIVLIRLFGALSILLLQYLDDYKQLCHTEESTELLQNRSYLYI